MRRWTQTLAGISLLAAGCRASPPEVELDFSERTPTTFAHHSATPLKVVVDSSAAPPAATRQDLATLAHKLGAVLGRSVEVVFAPSASLAAQRLGEGRADMALLAAGAGTLSSSELRRVVAQAYTGRGPVSSRLVVIARADVSDDERERWRTALLRLHEQPSCVATLARLRLERFVAPSAAPGASKP
ncbi:MAG: hypothetical protein KC503_30150 [Myxococcales bacterium]|nr:hypothetical protein [Myxococcales bacterium]